MSLRIEVVLKRVRLATGLIKSLSNPNRLSIVCCLVRGEMSLSEPTLLQQLAGLRESEIFATLRDVRRTFYWLKDDRAGQLVAFLEQVFCDDETRRVLRSKFNSFLLKIQCDSRSTLGSAQFGRFSP